MSDFEQLPAKRMITKTKSTSRRICISPEIKDFILNLGSFFPANQDHKTGPMDFDNMTAPERKLRKKSILCAISSKITVKFVFFALNQQKE